MKRKTIYTTTAAQSIAQKCGIDFNVARQAIREAVRTQMRNHGVSSLPADSVVPVQFPGGTRAVLCPDFHVPARNSRIRRLAADAVGRFPRLPVPSSR